MSSWKSLLTLDFFLSRRVERFRPMTVVEGMHESAPWNPWHIAEETPKTPKWKEPTNSLGALGAYRFL
jgi:hypothetical protein